MFENRKRRSIDRALLNKEVDSYIGNFFSFLWWNGYSLVALLHFNMTEKEKKTGVETVSRLEGFRYYARRWGDCCSRNSFLCEENLQLGNKPFYASPSPVIGCHWSCVRGKRLHGSFPDFPGDFFFLPPLHFVSMAYKPLRCSRLS